MNKKKEILELCYFSPFKIEERFKTSIASGLSFKEAELRLKKYGKNEVSKKVFYWPRILLRQIQSVFLYLLLVASLLSFVLGEIYQGTMILFFVFLSVFLGFIQEYRSEKTIYLLNRYIHSWTKVIREGKILNLPSSEIVPGDVVLLERGDRIPADVYFVEAQNLAVDESILTGESVSVNKQAGALFLKEEIKNLYQAKNLGFSGTIIVSGRAKAIVVRTGKETVIGSIFTLIKKKKQPSDFEKSIIKLSRFSLQLIIISLVLIFFANLVLKHSLVEIDHLFIFFVALTVSVVPEALPVVTTASFAKGALQLARKKVVLKRLSAIEGLGRIEVLCTDKTGTITENRLKLVGVKSFSENISDQKLVFYANLASSPQERKTEPFELALWQVLTKEEKREVLSFPCLKTIPFDPLRKRNTTLVIKDNSQILISKGAPENILSICTPLDEQKKKKIFLWMEEQGKKGARVLALAKKEIKNKIDSQEKLKEEEKDLRFLGLIAFNDPIKKSAFKAVRKAQALGIKIKIISGDAKEVTGAVAFQLGLVSSPEEVITGNDWSSMSLEEKHQVVERYSVFARISPEQKHEIVRLLQKKYNVGFLGEGINDIPALKTAAVSLVVHKAVDIARESSDIILLKKDLNVIINGIKEGRRIIVNIAKYIKATLAANFGNFYALAISSLFVPYLPMLPSQVLLVNLLSDFPMLAIVTDRVEKKEIIIPKKYPTREILVVAIILGLVSAIFDFIFFGFFFRYPKEILQTMWFVESILSELLFIFSIRTPGLFFKAKRPSFSLVFLTGTAFVATIVLPYTEIGKRFFGFVKPDWFYLKATLIIVVVYFLVSEIIKLVYYKNKNQ